MHTNAVFYSNEMPAHSSTGRVGDESRACLVCVLDSLQVGIANLGNSLAAVRDQVFSGKLSQQELAAALANDFAGEEGEALRLMLANRIAKYGNDDDSVDDLLVRAYQTFIDEISQFHNTRYGRGPIGEIGRAHV